MNISYHVLGNCCFFHSMHKKDLENSQSMPSVQPNFVPQESLGLPPKTELTNKEND